ncbi:murein hydrolase activator EnvC family protein [Calditerrivibrio sp.]|uniref:M23ase beta-sheet core domain-containing protein n=1 Tax=Calditerrivibrio nitroreducens TaxID=477976 RepID=A0A2J6WHH6_9BACT|nr:MAG: hypothetical protein C0187_06305 [Calditerrivibrio nitroreducens]
MNKFWLIFILFFPLMTFSAENKKEIIESSNDLMLLKKEIEKEKSEIKKIDQSKTSVGLKLKVIEKEIAFNEAVLSEINKKYSKVKENQQLIGDKIYILTRDIEVLMKEVRKGNIYLVDNRGVINLKLLIFSRSYHEMIKNLEIIEKVNIKLKDKISQIATKKKEIEELNKQFDEKSKELENLKKIKWEVLKELQNQKVIYMQTLTVLDVDKKHKESYYLILQSRYEDLNKRVLEIEKENKNTHFNQTAIGFGKLKGLLDWPVKGKIVEGFGVKYVESLKTEIYNKGVKIEVNGDGFVRSVHDGVVKYVDWIKGYGNLVIISHPDDFYTIYANIDDVLVKNGQRVSKGEKIGIIDVDIKEVQHYLYFEIRKNNNALNPQEWLKKEAT